MRLTTQSILSALLYPLLTTAVQEAQEPTEFQPSRAGSGSSEPPVKSSPHFQVYGVSPESADLAIKELEAAYSCFVGDLGWRSSGLSYNPGSDEGPYYKMNVFGVSLATVSGAAGQMHTDARTGLALLKIASPYITQARTTVHEYGHALTYHERNWVDEVRTGSWWETVAQFVSDTYMTSPLCEKARKKHGRKEGASVINLYKVIGDSHQVIVDGSTTGNYYEAWPLLTYMTNNPDNFTGLGPATMKNMFRKYKKGSNETPLHALERMTGGDTSVQKIVARYWARMAYVDIGHAQANKQFQTARAKIKYANLEANEKKYRVKANRAPKYLGANIIPLKGTGSVSVKITAAMPFTATVAVKRSGGVKYIDLAQGAGQFKVADGEEASLVVVNTPEKLIMYNGFKITGPVAEGLNYELEITGASA